MIINIPQQSPRGLTCIGTVYLDFKTFKTEVLVQLLSENMFILDPDYLKLVRKEKSRATIFSYYYVRDQA